MLYIYEMKLTAWDPSISRVTFALEAFSVIVGNADSLFATGNVFRFTATLFSCAIRKQEHFVSQLIERFILLNVQIKAFSGA